MYSISQSSGKTAYNLISFICDSEEDIKDLPTSCKPGSDAFVINPPTVYILNHQKQWQKI